MTKTLVLLCAAFFLAVAACAAPPTFPKEHSPYAVLIDAQTGKILWGRNENVHREMASTTKMMSALLLLERGHLNDIVTAPNGINKLPESSLHLSPGETLTLHDLLYAMLLRSANDAAVAGADYLSGSVPAFVDLMNQRAAQLGLDNTHFVTPNGLYAPDHYSTAADLAHLAAYVMATQPVFDQIVQTQNYKIQRSMHVDDEWMHNTATKFLKTFPGANGVKTGYIHQAGHCFVGSATRSGWQLIAVALDSNTCREDVESILNYGYANFSPAVVVPQGTALGTMMVPRAARPVAVQAASVIRVVVPKNKPRPDFQIAVVPLAAPPALPIQPGEPVGTVRVTLDGKPEATGIADAVQAVPAAAATFSLGRRAGVWGLAALKVCSEILGLLMLLAAGGMIYGTAAKDARRRRRRLAARLRGMDSTRTGASERAGYH